MPKIVTALQDQGVELATNQVQYSLLYRAPERNGVIQACKDTNTALLAYSPITQGLLSGTLLWPQGSKLSAEGLSLREYLLWKKSLIASFSTCWYHEGVPWGRINSRLAFKRLCSNYCKTCTQGLGWDSRVWSDRFLAGKYTTEKKPGGPREALFNDDRIKQIQPLLSQLKDIGSAHGKSQAQVAVNWIISKGEQNGYTAIPILGEFLLYSNMHPDMLSTMGFDKGPSFLN